MLNSKQFYINSNNIGKSFNNTVSTEDITNTQNFRKLYNQSMGYTNTFPNINTNTISNNHIPLYNTFNNKLNNTNIPKNNILNKNELNSKFGHSNDNNIRHSSLEIGLKTLDRAITPKTPLNKATTLINGIADILKQGGNIPNDIHHQVYTRRYFLGGALSGITKNLFGKDSKEGSGLGGIITQGAGLLGNLIGGTEDRVEGTGSAIVNLGSKVASKFGLPGQIIGGGLTFINNIFGKRANKLADQSSEFSSGFSGAKNFVHNTVDKYSGKKGGLFDFGFASKANRQLAEAQRQQGIVLNAQEKDKRYDLNIAGEYITANNDNYYRGYQPQITLNKNGAKIPELDNARNIISSWSIKSTEKQGLQKFQIGGKLNLIPEGTLHARKHNLEEVNPDLKGQITNKGIPVIAQAEGGIIQQAEIEKDEWTLRKEFTDELEALYKLYQENKSSEVAIKAGKLICYELLKNTDDRSGLIKTVK